MIQHIDARLAEWVKETVRELGNVEPSFEVPRNAGSGLGVNIYLYEIVQDLQLARSTRPFPQAALRYLVTAHGADARASHQILGLLLSEAAVTNSLLVREPSGKTIHYRLELELEAMPSHIWSAFGIDPRPCFILRIQLPSDWPARPVATPVMGPPDITTKPLISLIGQISWQVGRNKSAVIGATVELQNPHRQAFTDSSGLFALGPLLPTKNHEYALDLRAPNGLNIPLVPFKGPGSRQQPVSIELTSIFGSLVDQNGQAIANATITLPTPERVLTYYRQQARQVFLLDPNLPDNQITELQLATLLPDYVTPYRQAATDFEGRFTLPAILRHSGGWSLQVQVEDQLLHSQIRSPGTPRRPVQVQI